MSPTGQRSCCPQGQVVPGPRSWPAVGSVSTLSLASVFPAQRDAQQRALHGAETAASHQGSS